MDMMTKVQRAVALMIVFGALVCGVIGLVAGLSDNDWKLGVNGWFTGGILGTLIGIAFLADGYFQSSRKSDG